MDLDLAKTKITYVADGYKFLGFEIRLRIKKPKIMRVTQYVPQSKQRYSRTLKRTTSRQLTVEPDSNRILKRLKRIGFCNKFYFPTGKTTWRVYDEFQIVQKYSQIFRGIFNYYRPCERLAKLSRISYILQYSCAKTLAGRKKTGIRNIFRIYSKKMLIKRTIQGTKELVTRITQFFDLTTLKKLTKNQKSRTNITWDPFRIQEH